MLKRSGSNSFSHASQDGLERTTFKLVAERKRAAGVVSPAEFALLGAD
jgi:hypothetical protein